MTADDDMNELNELADKVLTAVEGGAFFWPRYGEPYLDALNTVYGSAWWQLYGWTDEMAEFLAVWRAQRSAVTV